MIDIDEIISELPDIETEQRAKLFQALLRLAQNTDATESFEDLIPIDVPLEFHKDEKSGDLQIRFAYQLGYNNPRLCWRVMHVTPGAQLFLARVFLESIETDQKAGRIQSKPTLTQ